jgi:hypothetical protein
MTTQTTTLTDFLLARIAEDEATIRNRSDSAPVHYVGCYYYNNSISPDEWSAKHCDCAEFADPVPRQLAECEAKRRIVDLTQHGCGDDYERVQRALALPYADHPDYRPAWRP